MLCRYETPMVVTGIPDGARNPRRILGKRSGEFELREFAPGNVVGAGRLVRPSQIHGDKTYFAAVDGSGLFTDLGALRGAFLVDSTVPAIDEALKALQFQINNHEKSEIRKLWHPPELAAQMLGYMRPAARQFRDLGREQDRISSFDVEAFDRQHEELGAKLAATCATCDGRLYNVEQMPFIAVSMSDKEVTVTAEIVDVCEYLSHTPKCVKLFGITQYDVAMDFAEELAAEGDLKIGGHPFEFACQRPEYFAPGVSAWDFRVAGHHLAATFKASVGRMGALSVARDIPFEVLAIARSLLSALDDPQWASKLDALEEAATAAIDYDDAEGTGYFVNRQDPAHVAVVELWKDRVVDVGFSAPRPAP
ncbi:hypothetical protein O9X98_04620 [Agrobacterium salinitolerans]|nr:hypothetical protein [Agrobacterium salinitolerans]